MRSLRQGTDVTPHLNLSTLRAVHREGVLMTHLLHLMGESKVSHIPKAEIMRKWKNKRVLVDGSGVVENRKPWGPV